MDRIVIDPKELLDVSFQLQHTKDKVEEVVERMPYIKRMIWETWEKDNTEREILSENCQELRVKTIHLMAHVEQRFMALREATNLYEAVNDEQFNKINLLSTEDIF